MKATALTAAALATALTLAPLASADVQGVTPFVGTWYGMRESVDIDSAGNAHFQYVDSVSCPSCSMADMPYRTMDFVITSVSGGVAGGSVTASSGTRNAELGQPVTVTLSPQPGGQAIEWTIGGKREGLFCSQAIASWCGG